MIDKIYLLHYSPLKERLDNILPIIKSLNIPYEIITEYDKEDLTDQIISQFYNFDKDTVRKRKEDLWHDFCPCEKLNLAEISLTIKHFSLYEKISKSKDEIILILEDDAILCDNFLEKVSSFLQETPKDWDIIWLGLGCGEDFWRHKTFFSKKISENVYKVPHPASNCSEAILIKSNSAESLKYPFSMVIDWELAWQMYKENMNVYWWTPLVTQGSKNGKFNSELR